jgi:hypothetical protein
MDLLAKWSNRLMDIMLSMIVIMVFVMNPCVNQGKCQRRKATLLQVAMGANYKRTAYYARCGILTLLTIL